jgi:predicted dinucleotide-utilizing enzyme
MLLLLAGIMRVHPIFVVVEIENVPPATNPRTGLLSIYSSIAMLAEYARTRRRDKT